MSIVLTVKSQWPIEWLKRQNYQDTYNSIRSVIYLEIRSELTNILASQSVWQQPMVHGQPPQTFQSRSTERRASQTKAISSVQCKQLRERGDLPLRVWWRLRGRCWAKAALSTHWEAFWSYLEVEMVSNNMWEWVPSIPSPAHSNVL